jgi:hypothetical protein
LAQLALAVSGNASQPNVRSCPGVLSDGANRSITLGRGDRQDDVLCGPRGIDDAQNICDARLSVGAYRQNKYQQQDFHEYTFSPFSNALGVVHPRTFNPSASLMYELGLSYHRPSSFAHKLSDTLGSFRVSLRTQKVSNAFHRFIIADETFQHHFPAFHVLDFE